ncbi:hypothetical protein DPMN_039564 [Dreissena polymorpha]|uniref:Uncharacterized protein n=1 Tax=Dreissena polymorpha TaxID=45954 RepID=A0A9D4CV16_DREPO|nr:hypothetical protein DPMN_039564 [Dreissena polymorpha]
MAEGGIDRSQTESVPGHSSLYSRHSQVRQGLIAPKVQQPVRPLLTGKHWNKSVPVHISLYNHLEGKLCTGKLALLDTVAYASFTYV